MWDCKSKSTRTSLPITESNTDLVIGREALLHFDLESTLSLGCWHPQRAACQHPGSIHLQPERTRDVGKRFWQQQLCGCKHLSESVRSRKSKWRRNSLPITESDTNSVIGRDTLHFDVQSTLSLGCWHPQIAACQHPSSIHLQPERA